MTITVEGVWLHMPVGIKLPDQVTADGQQGVTANTYQRIADGVEVELSARLAGLQVTDEDLLEHDLLNEAACMWVAARILRKLRTYQEIADSLFADANIKLRVFLENLAGVSEDVGTGATVSVGGEHYLPDPEDWSYGFKVPGNGA